MSRWTPTETLRAQTLSHDWHLQLHVAVSCLLSEEKDRYRFIIKTWKHPNLRRNDLVLLVLTTTYLFLDTNVPLKNIWCQNKKIGVYMFLKNTLAFRFVRFSRTLPHPEVEETEDRIGCRVPVFVWCDWTVFTRYVPACWWRQNQDFIEKPGSFPHSNQVVFVS